MASISEQDGRSAMNREEDQPVALPQRPSMVRRVVLGIVLLGALGGAVWYWLHSQGHESTDDAQIDGSIYPVSAKVGGTVLQVLVQDNQYVEAGTVLVRIDPKDYEVSLDKAKADLAESQAKAQSDRVQIPIVTTTSTGQLSSAQAGVGEARAGIVAAERQKDAAQARVRALEAMVRQAKANADRAARDLERYRALLSKDEIAQQQFDAAKAAADASHAQFEATQAQVREAEQSVFAADSQIELQRARLARAESDARTAGTGPQQVAMMRAKADSTQAEALQRKAQVEQAELSLGYTVVKAPVSGVVSQKNVHAGQIVQGGQPLLAVVAMDDIWVTANFKENQLAKMRAGQKVEVKVDAYGGRSYQGHVESIAAGTGARFSLLPAENATGNYVKVVQRVPVKILFEKGQDSEHVLRPGMSVVPVVETR